MFIKNISSRAHHVGDKTIVPGEIAEIPEEYESSINTAELIAVDEEGDPVDATAAAPKKTATPKKR